MFTFRNRGLDGFQLVSKFLSCDVDDDRGSQYLSSLMKRIAVSKTTCFLQYFFQNVPDFLWRLTLSNQMYKI